MSAPTPEPPRPSLKLTPKKENRLSRFPLVHLSLKSQNSLFRIRHPLPRQVPLQLLPQLPLQRQPSPRHLEHQALEASPTPPAPAAPAAPSPVPAVTASGAPSPAPAAPFCLTFPCAQRCYQTWHYA